MSSDDHGDRAGPHRGRPGRAQQQPQTGPAPDGTRWPEGEQETPPGDEPGAQGAHRTRGTPPRGSGTTRPVGGPTTSHEPGAAPPPPTPHTPHTPPPSPGGPAEGGPGTPAYGSGGAAPGGVPPYGAAVPPTGPDATSSAGPGATPPPGPGATSSAGPGKTPPPGPDATSSAGPGATPPPGPGGSPYDRPPGAMPPPPPPYGGTGGTGGEAYGAGYGAPDPRLAGMPPLAGLGRRLLARIIDGLVVYVPVSLFLALIGSIDDFGDTDNTGSQYGWGLFGILIYLAYEGLMLTRSGQTVGKKLMGIRVGMLENGAVPAGNPGWIRAAVYSLPGIVPCLGTLFWLYNVLSCTWDKPYRQCVHDKAAKTVVVSTEGRHFTP
ncbi:RDD family protein [Streptomyces sp. MAR4 CNX-425]|uniref:RDD family protein n=1 Tax=Streptomyces sp. MAR4 CNX-425 TaxID=3406343 RepID=UPI003B5005A7